MDWYVRKSGLDNNGGSSPVLRSSGSDGVTNGTNTFTSASAAWTAGDVGHGIWIGTLGVWRTITGVVNANTVVVSGAALAAGSGRSWRVGGPWLTVAKATGSTVPVAAGDSVYVGAGVYREGSFTTGNSGSLVGGAISLVGDVDGARTGDAGEVRIVNSTAPDRTGGSGGNINFSSSWWSFSRLVLVGFVASTSPVNITAAANNLTFTDCAIIQFMPVVAISLTGTGGTPSNVTFDRCIIVCQTGTAANIVMPTAAVDYASGLVFRNCWVLCGSTAGNGIFFTTSGALAGKPTGGLVEHCTMWTPTTAVAAVSTWSATTPVVVRGCLLFTSTSAALSASAAGVLSEDYNVLATTGALGANVVKGGHSVGITTMPLVHFGQERIWGGATRPFMSPQERSPLLAFGSPAPPAVDLLERPRPSGAQVLDSGTASAGGAQALTDASKAWGSNVLKGCAVRITSGTGSGQVKSIAGNTATSLTVDGNWVTVPDATSSYVITDAPATEGRATSSTTSVLTDSAAAWTSGQWAGFILEITAGTGAGQVRNVSSNTTNSLTVSSVFTIAPDATSEYSVYRRTSVDAVLPAAGAMERHDAAKRTSLVVDASTYAAVISGSGDQDVMVPVDAAPTTITVRCQYDPQHGSATPPQALLLANGEIGVAAASATASPVTDVWETLTLGPFTPAAKGWVTVRLRARGSTPGGQAYFDSVAVA